MCHRLFYGADGKDIVRQTLVYCIQMCLNGRLGSGEEAFKDCLLGTEGQFRLGIPQIHILCYLLLYCDQTVGSAGINIDFGLGLFEWLTLVYQVVLLADVGRVFHDHRVQCLLQTVNTAKILIGMDRLVPCYACYQFVAVDGWHTLLVYQAETENAQYNGYSQPCETERLMAEGPVDTSVVECDE